MNIAGPIVWVLALVLLFCTPIVALAQAEPYRVLILNSFRHTLPVNTDWYNGLVRGFTAATDLRVEIYIESPDVSRFGDSHYVSNLLAIYRRKYEEEKPHLIVPTYTPALQFLLDHGESLFPGIPIIFCGADSRFVGSQELMPHITGVTIELDVRHVGVGPADPPRHPTGGRDRRIQCRRQADRAQCPRVAAAVRRQG